MKEQCYNKKCSAHNTIFERNCGKPSLRKKYFFDFCESRITKKKYIQKTLIQILKLIYPPTAAILFMALALKTEKPLTTILTMILFLLFGIWQKINTK